MKNFSRILAIAIVACMALSVSALAADVTWKDYQDYLVEAAGGNAPDLAEFQGQVAAIGSWDEIPLDVSPWDLLFTTLGISTWDEFVAAGGVGRQSSEAGSDEASGEASDEQAVKDAYIEYLHEWLIAEDEINDTMTEEIRENEFMPLIYAWDFESFPAEMLWSGMLESGCPMTYDEFAAQYQPASGEPSGEASGEAASVEDAYIEYLHEWLIAEDAINDTMTEDIRENEFMPLIYAWDFESFPAEMLWSGMLESGCPMTFEEFAAQY